MAATFHVETCSLRFALDMAAIPLRADAERFGSGAAEFAPRYWPAPPVEIDDWRGEEDVNLSVQNKREMNNSMR